MAICYTCVGWSFWYGGNELLPQGRCGRHLPPVRSALCGSRGLRGELLTCVGWSLLSDCFEARGLTALRAPVSALATLLPRSAYSTPQASRMGLSGLFPGLWTRYASGRLGRPTMRLTPSDWPQPCCLQCRLPQGRTLVAAARCRLPAVQCEWGLTGLVSVFWCRGVAATPRWCAAGGTSRLWNRAAGAGSGSWHLVLLTFSCCCACVRCWQFCRPARLPAAAGAC